MGKQSKTRLARATRRVIELEKEVATLTNGASERRLAELETEITRIRSRFELEQGRAARAEGLLDMLRRELAQALARTP